MHYAVNLLNHIQAVRECAARCDFKATINAVNLALEIEKGDLKVRFQPRFIYFDLGKMQRNYTYYLRPDIRGFIGWLPYFNKVWPIALDKLAFKAWCGEHGLPTPDYWTAPSKDVSNFLIKRKGGSFGAGLRGPFRTLDSRNPYHQLGQGEYYERFIEGRIVKVWYWNADPVVLEILDCPKITGDGKRTVRELLESALGESADTVRWPLFESVITYQGKQLKEVLEAIETIYGGFRYGSLLAAPNPKNRNVLGEQDSERYLDRLRIFGKALYESTPNDIRPGMLFTADAVLDSQGRFWLLESNPNPAVHPDVYGAMIQSVLERRVSGMPGILSSRAANSEAMRGGLVWAQSKAMEGMLR